MLERFKKAFLLAGLTSVIAMALVFVAVKAGSLTPPGAVGSTMHNLLEIYNSIAGDNVTHTGPGLDDMSFGGTFTGATSTYYRIQIDAIGAPDTFKWSDDGGTNWDVEGVVITGLAQILNNGITITFGATTGHSLNDRWDFYRQVADEDGNIIEQLKYISGMTLQQIYNNSGATPTITGSSANAILTVRKSDVVAGSILELKDSADSVVFSVDNTGNIIMGATTLLATDSVQISSGGTSDLVLSAGSGKIKAATGSTFYNKGGYAIATFGEEILRASIPIFGYDFPARYANSAAPVKISRDITLDANSFPAVPAGADRIYKFKIQYANDAINANTSLWEIYAFPGPALFAALNLVPNTGIASLDETEIYYSELITTLPAVDIKWYLQVTAPTGTVIQIYQIELLAYDVLQ